MSVTEWSPSEKKIARRVFDAAVERELAEIMAEFKARAAKAKTPADMWDVRDYLTRTQRAFDAKYDFRYSQLLFVFGLLLREKRIDEAELKGLAEKKLASMRVVASL
jgi:hypothetical protein